MAYITQRIGEGRESFEMMVSDVYGDPAREFAEAQRFWVEGMSLRWRPALKPKRWWFKKLMLKTVLAKNSPERTQG